ncbi:MAG TPA: phosphotransferase [Streptosporangiaceae bacterium]|nr:phosphotransferase [Streptosporangiaceae bacterium]
MTDAAVAGRLLDEYHERLVESSRVRVIAGSEHQARVTYQVGLPDGASQVIRAFRADEPVPLYGRDVAGENVAGWLTGCARTLAALADAAYAAPRPVRTRTGELVGVAGPWLTWATTYVPGPVVTPTLDQLRQEGAALGHLHSVAALKGGDRIGDGPPGLASRHPAVAIPASFARLDRVEPRLPASWRSLHAECLTALTAIAAAADSVPESIVHGDVWARNAVQSSRSGVTFVDWETGGIGLAVIDLGNALLECHLDADVPDDQPSRWLVAPSPDRIRAFAEGYASMRVPTAAELGLLPVAVKFSAAVVGSVHFEVALMNGVTGPAMDARVARLQNRLGVADEVAAIARDWLTS